MAFQHTYALACAGINVVYLLESLSHINNEFNTRISALYAGNIHGS